MSKQHLPVIAVTAWQMLFEYARAVPGQSVFILGAAGNVGAYAVQLAVQAGIHVLAAAGPHDAEYVRRLGAERFLDSKTGKIGESVQPVDAIIDTVGGDIVEQALRFLKAGGMVVSVVSTTPAPQRPGLRSVFFYVEVTTARLDRISELLDHRKLLTHVETVLPLEHVRAAHEMLAGAPHERGKIVLNVGL
jgi:NADPH:quinone reductase-like Zn-dependent oxidoreductase